VKGVGYYNTIDGFPYGSAGACASWCSQTQGCTGYVYQNASCSMGSYCHILATYDATTAFLQDCATTTGMPYPVPYSFSTGDGFLHSFAANASVVSYLSNFTCGMGIAADAQGGSPFAPQGEFVVCTIQGGFPYVTTAAYNLPPQEACDQSKTCVGFMAMADGSQGWLLLWSTASATSDVARFSSNLPPA
jgi:hypothetical protein